MFLEPQSFLSVHHLEHSEKFAVRRTSTRTTLRLVPRPLRSALVATLRVAYVRARAAHVASSLPA